MSARHYLPLVALLTFGVARPAFPCEGHPDCPCNKKDAKPEECGSSHCKGDECDKKCEGTDCAKKHDAKHDKHEAKAAPAKPSKAEKKADLKNAKVVEMTVTEKGFEPASIKLAKGVPVKLVITRKTDRTCAKQIVVKDYAINTDLPLNTAVEVALTPKAAGNVRYACSMDHVAGVLVVE